MKELIRKFYRNDRGAALVLLLLVLPMLTYLGMLRIDHNRLITSIKVDFNGSLKKAVEAATNQVTEKSQAEGDPRIHCDRAHNAFRSYLAKNLKLNASTLTPESGSPLSSAPEYKLIVYNGNADYASTGARTAYQYNFDGSTVSSYPLATSSFPKQFTVSETDVNLGTGGMYDVVLEEPGCVAVLKANLQSTTSGEIHPVRWASYQIHVN